MKKIKALLAIVLLCTLTTQAQLHKGAWQDDKNYHPFIDGVASPQQNGHTAVALEAGILNKNTLFKVGIGTGSWEESQAIIVVGASKRLFIVSRFETWAVAGSAFGITHRIDRNIAPQILENIQIDKALSVFFTLGTHVNLEHHNDLALQYGGGVRITLGRGNVNRSY